MPRKTKSKQPSRLKEKTRAEDERLRQELAYADPEKFKRAIKPLFRSREGAKRKDVVADGTISDWIETLKSEQREQDERAIIRDRLRLHNAAIIAAKAPLFGIR